jgi:hypothetical protein
MLFQGKRVEPAADGKDNPVIDLPVSEAVYLEGIGRVRRIETDDKPVKKAGKK